MFLKPVKTKYQHYYTTLSIQRKHVLCPYALSLSLSLFYINYNTKVKFNVSVTKYKEETFISGKHSTICASAQWLSQISVYCSATSWCGHFVYFPTQVNISKLRHTDRIIGRDIKIVWSSAQFS